MPTTSLEEPSTNSALEGVVNAVIEDGLGGGGATKRCVRSVAAGVGASVGLEQTYGT